jgi:DNA-binding LacI/PurR family transcriptional regulator
MPGQVRTTRNRTEVLRHRLGALSRELGPGAKLPTVRELVKRFGISASTLDRVLQELDRDGVIQRHHGSGMFVADRLRTATVGIVVGFDLGESGTSPFYSLFIRLARRHLTAQGYGVRFYHDADPAVDVFSLKDMAGDLAAHRLDGLVFVGVRHPEEVHRLVKQGIPVVAFTDCPLVAHRYYLDYPALVRSGVAELARQGCRCIALLLPFESAAERLCQAAESEFAMALAAAGLSAEPHPVRRLYSARRTQDGAEKEPHALQGYAMTCDLLAASNRPDALLSADDMLTRGALAALHKFNLYPGKEIAVATHANLGTHVFAGYEDAIVRIAFDPARMVSEMLALLQRLMAGETVPPREVLVAPQAEN